MYLFNKKFCTWKAGLGEWNNLQVLGSTSVTICIHGGKLLSI